jgi:hypothetical protein
MRKKRLVHVEAKLLLVVLHWVAGRLTTGAHVRVARVSRAGTRPERLMRLPTRGRSSGAGWLSPAPSHRSLVNVGTRGGWLEPAGCGVGFLAAVVFGERARGKQGSQAARC